MMISASQKSGFTVLGSGIEPMYRPCFCRGGAYVPALWFAEPQNTARVKQTLICAVQRIMGQSAFGGQGEHAGIAPTKGKNILGRVCLRTVLPTSTLKEIEGEDK